MFSEFQGPCPRPSASGCSRPCAVSCGASRVIIFPPPVLVTFPGPILTTCPQESVVGASGIPECSGMAPGSSGMPEGATGTSPSACGAEIAHSAGFGPKFTSRPVIGLDPRETVLGSLGMVLGSSGMVPGSSGMPEGAVETSSSAHGAEIAHSAGFTPKFTSRPIFGLDPRETVLGSLGMLEGGAGRSQTFRGAQIPRSGGFVPKSGPRRASRCSYIFNSRWIHPCRRSGGGSREPAGNGSEEKIPDPEKPGMEEADEAKEEKEVLEV